MELIGKTTINPLLFYSGKFSGYFTWVIMFLLLFNIQVMSRLSLIYNDYIAYFLIVIGLILSVLSIIHLGKSTRLGLPVEKTVFKTNGLYNISRNPMYLGFNLLTLAAIIYTFNIYIILLGIYSMIVYHLIILSEERFLANRFDNEYLNYKKTTRRYI